MKVCDDVGQNIKEAENLEQLIHEVNPEWGDGGYGTVPYAYVECFCNEAGTILQDVVDYLGDGYNGLHTVPQLDIADMRAPRRGKRIAKVLLNLLGAAVLVAVTWILAKIF